jgi:PAS domain S-box-containing protein
MVSQITQILHLSEEEIRDHPKLLVNAFDHQHRVWFWNKECEKYFGIAEEHALGRTLEDLFPNFCTNPKLDYMKRALSGECIYDADGRFQKNDLFYTQLVLPIKNKDGAIIGIVNIVRPSSDSTPRVKESKTQYLLSEVS